VPVKGKTGIITNEKSLKVKGLKIEEKTAADEKQKI